METIEVNRTNPITTHDIAHLLFLPLLLLDLTNLHTSSSSSSSSSP